MEYIKSTAMADRHAITGYSTPAALEHSGERELVSALQAGSVEAFNYLITLYHQPLYNLIYRMLGDPADASDTLQEVFLKVYRGAGSFAGKSSLKTWMYRIAMHEASNHRRWWKRHKFQETSLDVEDEAGFSLADRLEDQGESPLQQAMRHQAQSRVSAALESVSEPFRSALLLREVEGFSYEEIAEIMQVRVGTVKSRLIRGREMLRQRLECDAALCRELGLRQSASEVL